MFIDLQNEKLLAKLSAGDMVALEAKYHQSCLTTLSNEARSTRSKAVKVDDDEKFLISYIEESRAESKSVLVLASPSVLMLFKN